MSKPELVLSQQRANALSLQPQKAETVIFAYSAFLALGCNTSFWRYLAGLTDLWSMHGLLLALAVLLLLTGFFSLVLALFPFRIAGRLVLSVLLPLSALASYFMNQYGTLIDGRMIQSVFETDPREVLDLATLKLFAYFLLLGVIPLLLLWKIPLEAEPAIGPRLRRRCLFLVLALACFLLAAGSQYQSIASLARNNKEVRYYIIPNNFIKGIFDYAKEAGGFTGADKAEAIKVLAADAQRGASWSGRQRKSLFVLVVGETARAANFGLNGYVRNTTPQLAAEKDLINFGQMGSCGTDTAVSLPCMMSGLGRADYSLAKARGQENLLDVLQRAGLRVVWIDNQSGCKRVCERVEHIMTSSLNDARFCTEGECHDGILQEELNKLATNLQQDTLVVMHQMGSHGPAYYKRYPPEFARFQPACSNAQLDKCSREQIRNAYDNSILYTDHVLSGLIDTLRKASDRMDTGLFYLSDHGESLGELGLYLHGAPYMMAPEVQTHVPAVMWLSEGLQQARGLSAACMARKSSTPLSQDNLFDSVLGLMDVRTKTYRPALDVFRSCTRPV